MWRLPKLRRVGLRASLATVAALIVVSVAATSAVHYTESRQFCGQLCHSTMQPEFVAHAAGSHGRVRCVDCHVGAGTANYVSAKLAGVKRLAQITTGHYPRPIPSSAAVMPSVQGSCENCHRPDRFVGDVVRTIYEHEDDSANTESKTVLHLHVGGPIGGTGTGTGIHWHMNRENVVEYVALDASREKIPYVRVTTPEGEVREYFADSATPAAVAGKPLRRMDCLDCHSRPAHRFGAAADREVDAAIGAGMISAKIPYIRRNAIRALTVDYPNQETALDSIDRTLRALNQGKPSESDVRQAIGVVQALYRTNVFPWMKIGWGTYPNQMGHVVSNGCFRCHDDEHKTAKGLAIKQDCELCHAVDP